MYTLAEQSRSRHLRYFHSHAPPFSPPQVDDEPVLRVNQYDQSGANDMLSVFDYELARASCTLRA